MTIEICGRRGCSPHDSQEAEAKKREKGRASTPIYPFKGIPQFLQTRTHLPKYFPTVSAAGNQAINTLAFWRHLRSKPY
jgi:hypothetical protein